MSTAYSSAKQQYIGNGVTTEWGFDFPIKKHSELKVYLKRSTSPQVLLEEGVDYSFVTENTIAFPIKTGEAKLQATDVLALQRESVFESEYNFSNQQRLEPEEVMHADDNLERQIQELKRDVSQAIRIQPTSNIDTDEYFVAVESIYENLDNINNVSGISAEIVNCSDNISDISTVSSDIANVNAVGQSISNVNTVASNVSSVNTVAGVSTDIPAVANVADSVSTVAGNNTNITTVATNISDVNIAASNMAAIQAAPTAATNAANSATASANSATASATSANNSHIWAEGTDAQVQALGGVHSSKGWAEQSTNANIALTNSPYTTNRILEIPQDIKLELNNGTLTLKAGSKVYVPNGVGVFDVVTVANDITLAKNSSAKYFCFLKNNGTFPDTMPVTYCYSGSTAPTITHTYAMWYDTANNKIKWTDDNGSTWADGYSLPIAIILNDTPGTQNATSIDQVFNGFGYIGSTVFALPGVKVQIPNGRNEDGTFKSIITTTSQVSTWTWDGSSPVYDIIDENGLVDAFGVGTHFDYEKNFLFLVDGTIKLGCIIAKHNHTPRVENFEPYTVDSVLNSSLSNLSAAGRSYLSGLGMPSNRYIDLTLGASGSTYTAPANGYFSIYVDKGDSTQAIVRFENRNIIHQDTRGYGLTANSPLYSYIPVCKGQSVRCIYTYNGTFHWFRFVYAQGEQ